MAGNEPNQFKSENQLLGSLLDEEERTHEVDDVGELESGMINTNGWGPITRSMSTPITRLANHHPDGSNAEYPHGESGPKNLSPQILSRKRGYENGGNPNIGDPVTLWGSGFSGFVGSNSSDGSSSGKAGTASTATNSTGRAESDASFPIGLKNVASEGDWKGLQGGSDISGSSPVRDSRLSSGGFSNRCSVMTDPTMDFIRKESGDSPVNMRASGSHFRNGYPNRGNPHRASDSDVMNYQTFQNFGENGYEGGEPTSFLTMYAASGSYVEGNHGQMSGGQQDHSQYGNDRIPQDFEALQKGMESLGIGRTSGTNSPDPHGRVHMYDHAHNSMAAAEFQMGVNGGLVANGNSGLVNQMMFSGHPLEGDQMEGGVNGGNYGQVLAQAGAYAQFGQHPCNLSYQQRQQQQQQQLHQHQHHQAQMGYDGMQNFANMPNNGNGGGGGGMNRQSYGGPNTGSAGGGNNGNGRNFGPGGRGKQFVRSYSNAGPGDYNPNYRNMNGGNNRQGGGRYPNRNGSQRSNQYGNRNGNFRGNGMNFQQQQTQQQLQFLQQQQQGGRRGGNQGGQFQSKGPLQRGHSFSGISQSGVANSVTFNQKGAACGVAAVANGSVWDTGSNVNGLPNSDLLNNDSDPGVVVNTKNNGQGNIAASSTSPNGDAEGDGTCRQPMSLQASRLLEELKVKQEQNHNIELTEIAGNIVEFSKDQFGSRLIQQKFESATEVDKQMVFEELLPEAVPLMTDVFGNYVIQKILEHGDTAQRSKMADQLVGKVLDLSLQMYGCRVVQKALEVIDPEQQRVLVGELKNSVMKCIQDQNGNHVIQKCIECIPVEHLNFVMDSFHNRVYEMASHPYGCRVIQRLLEYCNADQIKSILGEIMINIMTLTYDQYGNYVIQHVLEHGVESDKNLIFNTFTNKIGDLSRHKFASNVIEKCVKEGNAEQRRKLTDEFLLLNPDTGFVQLLDIVRDRFGNYVIQRAIETHADMRLAFYHALQDHLPTLKKCTFGRHSANCLEKFFR